MIRRLDMAAVEKPGLEAIPEKYTGGPIMKLIR
jgi:hypothetical protein